MPPRSIRVRHGAPPPDLAAGFATVREEIGVPGPFDAGAVEEAASAKDAFAADRVDATGVPFLTVDPEGSRDLDQALHIEGLGSHGGFRVRYAIADVGAFVRPGGALDRAAWERGVTHYSPDGRAPLYPPELSEGVASLLPGDPRAALLWTIDLDARGAQTAVALARARVRSREQLTYEDAEAREDGTLGQLREVGALREALERDRGGVSLPVPEQEVHPDGNGGWSLAYRTPLPVEGFNAQISLLTGMSAADVMLRAGVGFLRTVPAPSAEALDRLRATASALGAPWPPSVGYPEFIRSLDPASPAHAAILRAATGLMRGAGYAAFDGAPPEQPGHAAIADEYAHVTAPLRRLADRYANECCLAAVAGVAPAAWAREALPRLAEAMTAADRRARALDRAVVDLVEASLLAGRVGETFDAVVVDVDGKRPRGTVQLASPAVRGRIDGTALALGTALQVRLVEADPVKRTVRFVPADTSAAPATPNESLSLHRNG